MHFPETVENSLGYRSLGGGALLASRLVAGTGGCFETNGCNNVHYLRRTTEQFLLSNKERPDLVLMDPPRLGAKPALPMLLELRARRLVYVSCDPQTLARDLRTLVDGGYELQAVEALDMFPQTYHTEAVARLQWQGA